MRWISVGRNCHGGDALPPENKNFCFIWDAILIWAMPASKMNFSNAIGTWEERRILITSFGRKGEGGGKAVTGCPGFSNHGGINQGRLSQGHPCSATWKLCWWRGRCATLDAIAEEARFGERHSGYIGIEFMRLLFLRVLEI